MEHAACCLGFGERPHLLLIGGLSEGNNTMKDAWILDLESMQWKEVLSHSQANSNLLSITIDTCTCIVYVAFTVVCD